MILPRFWLPLLCLFAFCSAARPQGVVEKAPPQLLETAPAFGTFFLLGNIPSVPYPFDPYRGTLPVHAYDGVYFVDNTTVEFFFEGEGGGMMMSSMSGPTPPSFGGTNSSSSNLCCNSLTNFTVNYLTTNSLTLGIAQTTNPWIALTIQPTTTNASYDVFGTTNLAELALPSLSRTNWTWLTRARGGPTNFSWGLTNWCERYFQLGTMEDADNDGLSTAYEQLVGKTSPTNANSPQAIYEGVIRKQSPNGWFKLNDAQLTNAMAGRASLTNAGGGFENDVFATAYGAYSFANSSDRLVLGEMDDPIGGGTNDAVTQGSFTLLFKTLAIRTTAKRYLLSQGTASANALAVYFDGTNSTDASLTGALRVGVGPNEQAILLDTNLVREAWYYLAVTCDETRGSNEVRWFLGQVGSPTLSCNSFSLGQAKKFGTNGPISVGNRDVAAPTGAYRQSASIKGVIDQVAFWERELTDTEINAQFNALHALSQGPSKAFDLTRWELTLPVDETNRLDNTHKPFDIGTAWLNSGFKYVDPTNGTQKYFYLSNGNQMVFEAPWNGADQDTASPATSLGSPRSELRETLANGDEFNWKPYDPTSGVATNTHTLQATCRLESVPSKMIFGQIHADEPVPAGGAVPAVTLFHEGSGTANKRIRLTVYYSPDRSVTNAGSQDKTYDIVSGVNLGVRIDYELKIVGTSNGTVTLTATVATNGVPLPPQPVGMTSDLGYSGWAATNVTLYFKAGCYYPKAATNSGTAKVTFSSLTATHQ